MKAVFKRDFRAYFTAPLGYVYIAMFLLAANLYFYLVNLSFAFSDLSGLFGFLLLALMFTTPLLTMRLFSEDLRQKTDQLLLTAPVRLRDIVLGKFFAALGVFVLALILTLIFPFLVSIYGTPNGASIVGNYTALFFAAAAYISIGLFVSALTESQLVAAVGSLGIFLALYVTDMLSAGVSAAWLRRILGFVSLFGRFDSFRAGLFSLSDIVFYLSVCALFLFLSVRALERKRWAA